jgi:DNA-binding XRE family transcriptional regulator
MDISTINNEKAYYDEYIHQKYKAKMDSNTLNTISEQVRTLRKQQGWSQQTLAELSGLDRTTIGALERNDYSDIGIRKVQRVLEILGKCLTLSDLGLPTLDQLQKTNNG